MLGAVSNKNEEEAVMGSGDGFRGLGVAAAAALALGAGAAQATIITFNDLAPFQTAPDNYGDRVAAADTDGFNYLEGFGFTPNVILEFEPYNTSQQYNAWNGYSGLDQALGHNSFNVPGEVRLIPDAGFIVNLHSFDIGTWVTDYPNSRVRVFDLGDSISPLFDTGLVTLLANPNGTGSDNYTFGEATPWSSAAGLRIVIEDLGDLGLDNVSYSQTPVPVPAALPLFASALAGVAALRRLRRNA